LSGNAISSVIAFGHRVQNNAFEDRHVVPPHHLMAVERLALFRVERRSIDTDQAHPAIMQQLERAGASAVKSESTPPALPDRYEPTRVVACHRGDAPGVLAQRVANAKARGSRDTAPDTIQWHLADRCARAVVVQWCIRVRAGVRRQRDFRRLLTGQPGSSVQVQRIEN